MTGPRRPECVRIGRRTLSAPSAAPRGRHARDSASVKWPRGHVATPTRMRQDLDRAAGVWYLDTRGHDRARRSHPIPSSAAATAAARGTRGCRCVGPATSLDTCPYSRSTRAAVPLVRMVRLPRQCAWPGCTEIVTTRYCAVHARRYERERSRQRGSAAARGYTAEWRRIRAHVLADEPRCRLCGAPATEVHHLVPLSSGGTHDRANLAPLCATCHRRVTAASRRRG